MDKLSTSFFSIKRNNSINFDNLIIYNKGFITNDLNLGCDITVHTYEIAKY